jgi:excisionase family DNA binding protein
MSNYNYIKKYRKIVREREKRVVVTAPPTDAPFLTTEQAAARLGIAVKTLERWVYQGIIPKPRRWGKRPGRRICKAPFRRSFVETIRQAIIIRTSTPGMTKDIEAFRKLCHKMALGLR